MNCKTKKEKRKSKKEKEKSGFYEQVYDFSMRPQRTILLNSSALFKCSLIQFVHIQDWSRKAGGCHMQWGLFTHPEADDWFKNVEFCFRFSSEGDVSQCGDGKAKEICTKVNHYTPEYYDHTDRRCEPIFISRAFSVCVCPWNPETSL